VFRASNAHHQESLTLHTASSFSVCVCLRQCFVRNLQDSDARFLCSIYMCITLPVSSVKRSSSGVPHPTYSLKFQCLCLSAALSCKKLTRQYRKIFIFYLYVYNSTCIERQALIMRSSSPYIQPPVSVFVSVCSTVL
jgi:hypothetical protein